MKVGNKKLLEAEDNSDFELQAHTHWYFLFIGGVLCRKASAVPMVKRLLRAHIRTYIISFNGIFV